MSLRPIEISSLSLLMLAIKLYLLLLKEVVLSFIDFSTVFSSYDRSEFLGKTSCDNNQEKLSQKKKH